MRDNRITLLKIENDSNAPEDPSLAPMVLSETIGSANVEPNLSARSGSGRWNVANSEPVRQSLGEKCPDGLGEPTHFKSFSDGTDLARHKALAIVHL
jgi:hypothetical protein